MRTKLLTTLACLLCTIGASSAETVDSLLVPMPDVNQLEGGDNGRMDCGPAAAADYLIWLRSNGYPTLVPGTAHDAIVEMERALNADSTGTGVRNFSRGITAYLSEKGYAIKEISCTGWRKGADGSPPRLDVLKKTLQQGGGVFLNFGWYKKEPGDKYVRFGGHWVCLTGFGLNAKGDKDLDALILHDPSPRCGSQPRNEYIKLTKLNAGTIITNKNNVILPAANYCEVASGWTIPRAAEVAILDAAVCITPSHK